MRISRRQFLTTLSYVVPVASLVGLDFSKRGDVAAAWAALEKDPMVFIDDGDYGLSLEGYSDDSETLVRGALYYFDSDVRSIEDLQTLLSECQPLCWHFNGLYLGFLDYVVKEEDVDDEESAAWGDPGFFVLLRRGEEPWPTDYDGNEKVLRRWSAAVGEEAFLAYARDEIDKWLGEEADGDEYDYDRFDVPPTGESYAFEYFSREEHLADKLGVNLVEGWHPGDDTRVAILEVPVEEANRRCRDLGVPIVFKKA